MSGQFADTEHGLPAADDLQPLVDAEAIPDPSAAGVPTTAVQLVRRRPEPLFHAVILAMSCGVVLLSIFLSVRDQKQVLLPLLGTPLPELCLAKRMTGLGCPGCGMTRCFISLGHGDLASAWSYNPAGLWFFAIVAFQIPYRAAQLWRIRRGLPELWFGRLAQWSFAFLAIAMISQWILKVCGASF